MSRIFGCIGSGGRLSAPEPVEQRQTVEPVLVGPIATLPQSYERLKAYFNKTCEYKYFLKLLKVTSVIKFNTLMLAS